MGIPRLLVFHVGGMLVRIINAVIIVLGLVCIGLVAFSYSRLNNSATTPGVPAQADQPRPLDSAPGLKPATGQAPQTATSNKETAPSATSNTANSVAVVNGTAITKAELENELNHLLISATTHSGMDSQKKDELQKAALEELIVRELAYQRGKSTGVVVDPLQLVAETRRIRNRYRTEKAFKEALAAEQITEEQLRNRVERDLLLKRIFRFEIEDKAKVSEAEVRRHYEENKEKFVVPESVQLKGMLIKIGNGGDLEARRKIDELYAKLKGGKDFGELAYKFSEDDYRVMGGDYGSVHRGQMPADLEQVVFAQKRGELSAPFKTSLGWHIVLVISKQPTHQLSYAEVADKIRTALSQKRVKQRRTEFIAALKATATIEYPNQ